jgi:hypothetical protein
MKHNLAISKNEGTLEKISKREALLHKKNDQQQRCCIKGEQEPKSDIHRSTVLRPLISE